ncbi:nucleotide kinase domain-containing protein [Streptosporangium sp. NPDC002721]|uniref:nucleotide kinase domain-containing protein n=1 Tax=Streptosporangium sp. NPDC002721 TaxID=3366188 RepID=UPI00368B6219
MRDDQDQLLLDLGEPTAQDAGAIRAVRVGSRTLQLRGAVIDTYWRFAVARQQVFHLRAAGAPPPWTTDPIIGRHKFTNVYRAADRVSQYLIRDVIYNGSQDAEELVFRVLLFKIFNKIETWELLTRELGGRPTWDGYDFATYERILGAAMGRGERIYSAAYIVPNPAFGEARKAGNHLALLLMPRSPFPRCTDDDKRLASALTVLGILDARPAEATPDGKRLGGCDDDDRLAYAEQSYRISASRVDVPSFYREAAIRDGWKQAPVPEQEEGVTQICLTKVINSRNVYLSVRYSGRPEEKDGGEYFLQASSGPSGGNLC